MIRSFVALLVLAAGCATHSADSGGAVVREIESLEAQWNTAHLTGDAGALERLSADDLVVLIATMEPMTKSDAFGVLRSGRMTFRRFETSDVAIRAYNRDTAVVTGRLQRTRAMGERTVEDDWRFTKVYIRGDGGWKVVSFHGSPAR